MYFYIDINSYFGSAIFQEDEDLERAFFSQRRQLGILIRAVSCSASDR